VRRPWISHLRLLPGGDTDPAAGLGVSLLIYTSFLLFGLIFGLVLSTQFQLANPNLAWVSSISVANAIPAAVLGLWVLARLRATRPLDADMVAVDVTRERVYLGDEVGRAPHGAILLPVRPRQAQVSMMDGARLKLFYRVNRDPEELLRLARLLEAKGETLEAWFQSYLDVTVPELLPDPAGIQAGLAEEALRLGVLVTQAEAA
jgi:hypothetical protein